MYRIEKFPHRVYGGVEQMLSDAKRYKCKAYTCYRGELKVYEDFSI